MHMMRTDRFRFSWLLLSSIALVTACSADGTHKSDLSVGSSEPASESPAPSPTASASPTQTPSAEPSPTETAAQEPPAPEGSIRAELDKNLARWVEEYKYPNLDQITEKDLEGGESEAPSKYFPELVSSQYLYVGKGERVVLSERETPQSPCEEKKGEFIRNQFFDGYDYDKNGVLELPRDSGAGPMNIDGPIRECFEHSSRGAVMAAFNHAFQYPNLKDYIATESQEKVIYSGTRKALNKMNFTIGATSQISDFAKKYQLVVPTGFVLDVVDETGMKLSVVNMWETPANEQILTMLPMTMIWEKGDWRVGLRQDEWIIDHIPDDFVLLSSFAGSSDDE